MTAVTSLEISDALQKHDRHGDAQTPTTPKASQMSKQPEPPLPSSNSDNESQISGGLSDAPTYPPPQAPSSANTQSPIQTGGPDEKWDSMEIDASDREDDGSDNDTENGEQETSPRKKKGQRFFCTGYPPCNLSFTRSEHLARHIRKHTGERPFQCHCNRRFSRLDNLRQHAQTVHVNEEIPTDSLAATGTRFQRQIRTDRVRPAGRPRTNTMSSTGSHGRGHTRNLSSSSIGSTSSNFSTSTEPRRRPPPLLMANDSSGRPKLGIEPPSTPPTQYRGFGNQSPGGLSTPTSTTYSATPSSPMYGSSMGSPMSTNSRVANFFGGTTPARRLSVPSGVSPFQPTYAHQYSMPYMTQMTPSSNTATNSSVFASPTSSTFSSGPSYQAPPGEDWRRRTWHPSTYSSANMNYGRPATSGLMYSQTPDAPQPAFAQNATVAAGQAPRLPGIESFDHVQHRPSTPPRRQPSPMQIDAPSHGHGYSMTAGPIQSRSPRPGSRPGHVSWDVSRSSTYPAPDEHMHFAGEQSSWGQQTINQIQSVGTRQDDSHRPSNMGPPPPANHMQHPQQIAQEALQLQPATPKGNKRHGWYMAPSTATRTSPEDSSSSEGISTPRTSAVEIHPAIVHSNGYIEAHQQGLSADSNVSACIAPPNPVHGYPTRIEGMSQSAPYNNQRNGTNEMTGLEALVAVATSEEKATAAVR